MWLCCIIWIVSLLTVIGVSFGSIYVNASCRITQTWLLIIQISASGVFGSAFTLWLTKIFDYQTKKRELLYDYLFKALEYYNIIKTIRPIIDIKDIEDIKKDYAEYNDKKLWNELQKIYVKISFINKKSNLARLVEDIHNDFMEITTKLDANFIATQSPYFEESFNCYKEDGTGLYDVVEKREEGWILVLKNSSETKLFPKMQELDYYLTGRKNLYESLFVPTYKRDIRK